MVAYLSQVPVLPGGLGKIYWTRLTPGGWLPPRPVSDFPGQEFSPDLSLTSQGVPWLAYWEHVQEEFPNQIANLVVYRWEADQWGQGDTAIASVAYGNLAFCAQDDNSAWAVAERYFNFGDFDLYAAQLQNGTWSPGKTLESQGRADRRVLTCDGLVAKLVYVKDRTLLYRSFQDQAWTEAEPVPDANSTSAASASDVNGDLWVAWRDDSDSSPFETVQARQRFEGSGRWSDQFRLSPNTVPMFPTNVELVPTPGAYPQAFWNESSPRVTLTRCWLGSHWSTPDTAVVARERDPIGEARLTVGAIGEDGRVWVAMHGRNRVRDDLDVFVTYSDYYRGARTSDFRATKGPGYAVYLSWQIRRNSNQDSWQIRSMDLPSIPDPDSLGRYRYENATELSSIQGEDDLEVGGFADIRIPELPARLYWISHSYPEAISDTMGPVLVDFSEFASIRPGKVLVYPNPLSLSNARLAAIRIPNEPEFDQVVMVDSSGRAIKELWHRTTEDLNGDPILDLTWDGRNDAAEIVASGVYWLAATCRGRSIRSEKIIVLP